MRLPVGGAALCVLAIGCGGCGFSATAPPPTPAPTAPPAPTPTVEVGFVVAVTPVATSVRKHPPAHSSPTPFSVPKSAYVRLIPASGPPADRVITVDGGHLPPLSQVRIVWSAGRRGASIEVTTQTDRRGRFQTSLALPASPPGEYTVTAQVRGSTPARAEYRIFSAADIVATVESTLNGERISVNGRRFLSKLRLFVVAYPVLAGSKPVVLGSYRTDSRGQLHFQKMVKRLDPGQYDLRAWSISQVWVLMAEAFFQVDV